MMMTDKEVGALARTYCLPERMTPDEYSVFKLYVARYQMYKRKANVSLFKIHPDYYRRLPLFGNQIADKMAERRVTIQQTAKEYERKAQALYYDLEQNPDSTLGLSRFDLCTRASGFVLEHAEESSSTRVKSSRAEAYLDKYFGKVNEGL